MAIFNYPQSGTLTSAAYSLPAAYGLTKLNNYLTTKPTMFPSRQQRARPIQYTFTKRPRKRSSRPQSFKAKMLNASTAFHEGSGTGSQATTAHGNIYTFSPTQNVTQGTSIQGRLGDSIYLEALKINGLYTSHTIAAPYSCRVIVGFAGEEFSATTMTTSGFGTGELFHQNTTSQLVINGIINAKAFTSLYDETIDLNSTITGVADWSRFSATIPLKQQFPYQEAASAFGKYKNLYVVVITAVLGGTNAVTPTGSITLSTDLIFKNN